MGLGAATKRSILQCNVGNKSPVYLCCLNPEKNECLQLHLEFDEADEVMFSVLGPRSVHLAGYYLGGHRPYNPDESYPFVKWCCFLWLELHFISLYLVFWS